MGATDALPHPSHYHLASSKPAGSRRRDAAQSASCTATPDRATLALSPSLLTSAPSAPGLVAPRRGSHAPRARRAPGPTERSSRPWSSRPLAGRRRSWGRRAEVRLAVTRRGARSARRAGDLATGARGRVRRDHPGLRSPRLRAVLWGPLWEPPYVIVPSVTLRCLPPRPPRCSGLGFD